MDSESSALHSESISSVDLRLLSQSDLYALSLTSSSQPPISLQDVVVPKIDRAIFNESVGSRKQTYSRLRLAPRKPKLSSVARRPRSSRDIDDDENDKIIGCLRELFDERDRKNGLTTFDKIGEIERTPILGRENSELLSHKVQERGIVPIKIVGNVEMERNPNPGFDKSNDGDVSAELELGVDKHVDIGRNLENEKSDEGVVVSQWFVSKDLEKGIAPIEIDRSMNVEKNSSLSFEKSDKDVENGVVLFDKKRKRERKQKSEKCDLKDGDREILNKNGVVVDLFKLANVEDPFGVELSRRTEGLGTHEEILNFLGSVKGEWGSRRKKKKMVDACDFGDVLPKGWKILLRSKRRAGRAWLICCQYISPSGQRFLSCKDVSSYLSSFSSLQDVKHPNLGRTDTCIIPYDNKVSCGTDAELTVKNDHTTIEPSKEVKTMQEIDVVPLGKISPDVLNMHMPIEIHIETSDANDDTKLTSDNVMWTCINKYSCEDEEENTRAKTNNCCLVENSHNRIEDDAVERVSEAADIDDLNICLGDNENGSDCKDNLRQTHGFNEIYHDDESFGYEDHLPNPHDDEEQCNIEDFEKHQISPQSGSVSQNQQKYCFMDTANVTAAESRHEKCSKDGLYISSGDSVNIVSSWTLDLQKTDVIMNDVDNCESAVALSSAIPKPDKDIVSSVEQGIISESSSHVPSYNEQISVEKGLFNPFYSVDNVSSRTMENPKLYGNEKSSELMIDFGTIRTRNDANVASNVVGERSFDFFSHGPSGNKQMSFFGSGVNEIPYGHNPYVQMNNVESNLGRVSTGTVGKLKLHQNKHLWDSELTIALGSDLTGLDAHSMNRVQQKNSESCSFVFPGTVQMYGNNVNENGIQHNMLGLNNMQNVYTDSTREGLRLHKVDHSHNDLSATDLGSNMWRTCEENALQGGLDYSAFTPAQSLSCFPTFNIGSNKDENDLFRVDHAFESTSDVEHLEFDFLSGQTNSHSGGSKISSYGVEMGQGFDSRSWIDAEMSLPKIVDTQHSINTICVWCRNEFRCDVDSSGMQTGSIGLMCPTCKAKF